MGKVHGVRREPDELTDHPHLRDQWEETLRRMRSKPQRGRKRITRNET